MTLPSLIWGSPRWLAGAVALLVLAASMLLWSYVRAEAGRRVKIGCAILKSLAFLALAFSLLEPLLTGTRPRRGANAFVVLADNSQSLRIRDDDPSRTRGERTSELLRGESAWKTRLGQDFDVRNYVFDSHLRAVDNFESLTFDGPGTALTTSLSALVKRFRGLPLAGVLLFTDGNRTDVGEIDWSQGAQIPIYPVVPRARTAARDVGVSGVSISQSNFESAPVVIRADVSAPGLKGEAIAALVVDEAGETVERQVASAAGDGKPLSFRFQFRPAKNGISFYHVKAFPVSEEKKVQQSGGDLSSTEQTLANNARLVVVDQGGGPYRVLYVSGRPNWEFKFLNRAIEEDKEVELIGLLRIAKRQPKFDFRDQRERSRSSLFTGFDNPDEDTTEQQDQPIVYRLGIHDPAELRAGFPKAADELYGYHAIILDDIEAAFFSPDQQALLRSFVSQRGGGLLMLGGLDSFAEGKYDRAPLGELLPVYLNRPAGTQDEEEPEYRLELTKEGTLQPWVRLRKTEDEERQRLAAMPSFLTLSRTGNIKPGAAVLSEVRDAAGTKAPALVAQSFGKGHVAALLVGDLYRWGMRRENPADSDLERSWRQTVRWLVADVPRRVELSVRPKPDSAAPALDLAVRVRDAEYRSLDNAKVTFRVALAGKDIVTLEAEPDPRESGTYRSSYVTKEPGPYRIFATAMAPDGSKIGAREAGWAAQPAADEFARLEPDREFLKTIATQTNGELVDSEHLDSFVSSLSSRSAPITEPWTSPLWHQPFYFLIAISCLLAEWGLRRVNGLA
jgi:uncharacterized membrane protein